MDKLLKEEVKKSAEAHSNLNAFGAIKALCEGGVFYGPTTHAAVAKIVKECDAQMQRQLKLYDAATNRIMKHGR